MAKTSSAHASAVSDEISQPARALAKVSDIAIARAVGETVRATPMVLDLSPGIVELAATYGPHERVTGVVVRHPNAHDITIEVHVVLHGSPHDGSEQAKARGGASHREATARTTRTAVLTRSAEQVRRAAYRAVQGLSMAPPAGVDVLIEDVQAST
jgi:hypothetical protein